MNNSIQGLRSQLALLQSKHQSGKLNARAYAAAKAPLEQQLVQAVLAEPAAAATPASERPAASLVALLTVAVVALAGAGYAWTGSPGAISAVAPSPAAAQAATEPHSSDEQDFSAAVAKLAQKLVDKPDNPEGWAMLARSYARLGRHAEAVPAFERAMALQPADARLLADYADTLAVRNDRSLQGEPTKVIERALALDPNQPKALALAGTAAFERKDFAGAVRAWERLAQLSPADSAFMPELEVSIREARERAGTPAGEVAAAAVPSTSAAAPAVPAARVQGRLSLSPSLAKLAEPDDTVFVFARAATGPRMPLAILRLQVKDLPLAFTLDDGSAMAPSTRLSLHPQVVIGARISKTGQAMPAPGDLVGQTATVANDAQGLTVEINEVFKR